MLWLSNSNPPLVLKLLTLAVNDPQLPPYAQILIVDVPVVAFPISVKILVFILA